jgi:hypothetical protein
MEETHYHPRLEELYLKITYLTHFSTKLCVLVQKNKYFADVTNQLLFIILFEFISTKYYSKKSQLNIW